MASEVKKPEQPAKPAEKPKEEAKAEAPKTEAQVKKKPWWKFW